MFHGGDLADGGSSPGEIADRIRDLGWLGVAGNADEIHTRPESLDEFAGQSKAPPELWIAVREMAAFTRERLGAGRIGWLAGLPSVLVHPAMTLVHATPGDMWRAPGPEAADGELESAYADLAGPVVVYGHIHRPFVRAIAGDGQRRRVIANSGSAGLPYDGDPRAAYLVLEDGKPVIRRVEYDVEAEVRALAASGLPRWEWVAAMLRTASPRLP